MAIALLHFKQTYKEKALIGMTRVIDDSDSRCIVRVCYGQTRPSGRACFAVYDDHIDELEFEAVVPYGEKVWR